MLISKPVKKSLESLEMSLLYLGTGMDLMISSSSRNVLQIKAAGSVTLES